MRIASYETPHTLKALPYLAHRVEPNAVKPPPPPSLAFLGREVQAALASRRVKRRAHRRLFPPPKRGRNKVGVATSRCPITTPPTSATRRS